MQWRPLTGCRRTSKSRLTFSSSSPRKPRSLARTEEYEEERNLSRFGRGGGAVGSTLRERQDGSAQWSASVQFDVVR